MKSIQLTSLLAFAAIPAFAASTFTGGHGDIGVALEGGTDFHLHTHLHENAIVDGSPLSEDTEFDAGDLTIVVPQSQATVVGTNLPAAGVTSGDTIWLLPQGNPGTDTVPFLGIGTEELVASDFTGDIVFALDSVTSPSGSGTFSLWQSDGLGGNDFYWSSAGAGLTVNGDNTFLLPPAAHDHANWGFNEMGEWLVTLTASGDHVSEGLLTNTQTFSFTVVPEPAAVSGLFSLAALLIARRRTR